jgi:DNA-directed RNA polymerase specialized sigma24 family protein
MDDETTHLTSGEVRRIISRLRGPDILRLSALARAWATGLRQHDADDLLNEALDRVLSGRRPWPTDLPLPAFLSQVMRSIASQWRRENRREPLKEDETSKVFEEESHNPSACYERNDLISRMRQALDNDPSALGVFDHILLDSDREDAQAALGLNATQYDTARRRMAHQLFEAFHSGWKHESQGH